ncbi:hypothetical protein [Bacillus niameyensis]|uniref:hypothetical protein n=1 Tax=Bacillus niameyensis TaxID=1522308 RepID=UPI0012B5A9F6|nr:hypothetical protein [Bacillus niameyensis]
MPDTNDGHDSTGTIDSESLPFFRGLIRNGNDSTQIVTMLPCSHPERARFDPNRYRVGVFPSDTRTIQPGSLPCCRGPIQNGHDSLRIVTLLPCFHPKRARFTPNRYLVTVLPSKTGTIHSESLPCYRASIQNGHDSIQFVTIIPCPPL